jgi:hypothetical protein
MALPTGTDVASFLGKTQDSGFIAQANVGAQAAYEFARGYCRGRGFEDDEDLPADLRMVVITAGARLATNPNMLRGEQAESYATNSGPDGFWAPLELAVLHRYRRRAA